MQGTFAALETLREEPKVSEALISSTLQQVKQDYTPGKIKFYQKGWLQVAAAVLVVGSLAFSLWKVNPDQPGPQGQQQGISEIEFAIESPGDRGQQVTSDLVDESAVVTETMMQPQMVGRGQRAARPAVNVDEFIPGEPPFAPASNIELTVLPRRENVQLTIYDSADLTLVRDKRSLTMKQGWNWLQFSWEGTLIDPTSLSLEPKQQPDKITVEQLVFPPRWKNLGRWLIKSEISGQVDFEITYLTSGIDWRAFYMGTLSEDEATMRLQGYVRVNNNSGEDYEDAQTRLLVGKVHLLDEIAMLALRKEPYGSPVPTVVVSSHPLKWNESNVFFDGVRPPVTVDYSFSDRKWGVPKEIVKEGLSEYFLYTIEGTETIENEWGKRLPSFEVEKIPVESLYKYDEEQWGKQTVRFVTFANDEDHELGETPIPNGAVKIYGLADAEEHFKYVGGTNIKYIPVNEEVELNLGAAREVKVEPVLMESRTENYEFNNDRDQIIGREEIRTWRVTVNNTRRLPVEVEITRRFDTSHWKLEILEGQVSGNKHDVYHERFELRVGPQSERVFTYKVRTYYGTRERVYQ
ncbi:MAG: DUF4139 domain-containing protein [Planctomycetes bacterium]|nr:DUF4139 domain-containing protein [Planctomycetota bacterium]